VRARPAGCPDEQVPAAEALDQRQADAARLEPNESDAWDGARRGEAVDVHHQLRVHLAAEDVGKSADPARVDRARDASFPLELPLALLGPVERDAVAEPYIPDGARSGEQSCAGLAFAEQQQPAEPRDAVYSEPREQQAMQRPSWRAPQAE
jgi:hypothetical protein